MNEMVRQNMVKNELNLSKYASLSSDVIRFEEIEEDIRPAYFRDVDRIIYSLSYTRYGDKTQVFSNLENDHISKRMTHVQLVSKIARTISRALNLNEDLAEAIALGHDIGHVPFGHTGERILNKISLEKNNTYFNHNVQSVRTLMNVEKNGLGINLCVQVLDGILCHNGEFVKHEYYPSNKTKEQFLEQYNNCYTNKSVIKTLRPMTLEGCVVRISDIIGYIGRDIEDALDLGVLDAKDLPKNITDIFGKDNRNIVNTVVSDIIENSLDKPYIKMSDKVYEALVELKQFNYDNIYSKANTKEEEQNFELIFRTLYDIYEYQITNNLKESKIFTIFLDKMDSKYLEETSISRKVIDYLAGMTDDYIQQEFNNLKTFDIIREKV